MKLVPKQRRRRPLRERNLTWVYLLAATVIVCIVFDVPVRYLSKDAEFPEAGFSISTDREPPERSSERVVLEHNADRTAVRPAYSEMHVLVDRVIDGDTFVAKFFNGDTERIRVIGIDTPELGGAACDREYRYASDAKEFAERLLNDRRVVLRVSERNQRDEYGRLLASAELPNGHDFGNEMLDARLAVSSGQDHDWCRSGRP